MVTAKIVGRTRRACWVLIALVATYPVNVLAQGIEALNGYGVQPEVHHFARPQTAGVDAYGDLNLQVPVMNIPGRGGLDFDVTLSYRSGIKTTQRASWVGLGWSFDPGSITRSPNGGASMNSTFYNVDFAEPTQYLQDTYYLTLPGRGTTEMIRRHNFLPATPSPWTGGDLDPNGFSLASWRPWRVEYFAEEAGYNLIDVNDLDPTVGCAAEVADYLKAGKLTYVGSSGDPPWEDKEEFSHFVVTTEDGTRYVFAAPTLSTFVAGMPPNHTGVDYQSLEYYVGAWRLVAILGNDYAWNGALNTIPSRANNNLDEPGRWVAFEYSLAQGLLSSRSGNTVYPDSWRHVEHARYLQEIITPTHYAKFEVSASVFYDGGCTSGVNPVARGEHRSQLNGIKLYKRGPDGQLEMPDHLIKEVRLGFDNTLHCSPATCAGANPTHTTLSEVYEIDRAGNALPGYSFDYGANVPGWNPDPEELQDFYSTGNTIHAISDHFRYFNRGGGEPYDHVGRHYFDTDATDARAWSLRKVTFPTGAWEQYDYENDQIDELLYQEPPDSGCGSQCPVQNFTNIPFYRYDSDWEGYVAGQEAYSFNVTWPPGTIDRFEERYRQGGVRVTSITRPGSDESGTSQVTQYEYGPGNATGIPSGFWQEFQRDYSDYIFTPPSRGKDAVIYDSVKEIKPDGTERYREFLTYRKYDIFTPVIGDQYSTPRRVSSVFFRDEADPNYITVIQGNEHLNWGSVLYETNSYWGGASSNRMTRRYSWHDHRIYAGAPVWPPAGQNQGGQPDEARTPFAGWMHAGLLLEEHEFDGYEFQFPESDIWSTQTGGAMHRGAWYEYDQGNNPNNGSFLLKRKIETVSLPSDFDFSSDWQRQLRVTDYTRAYESYASVDPLQNPFFVSGNLAAVAQETVSDARVGWQDQINVWDDISHPMASVTPMTSVVTTWSNTLGVASWKPSESYVWLKENSGELAHYWSSSVYPTDWTGGSAGGDWLLQEKNVGFDQHGQVTSRTVGGVDLLLEYGGWKNTELHKVTAGSGSETVSRTLYYDSETGLLNEVLDDNVEGPSFAYDESLRLAETLDAEGRVTAAHNYHLRGEGGIVSSAPSHAETVVYANGNLIRNGSFELAERNGCQPSGAAQAWTMGGATLQCYRTDAALGVSYAETTSSTAITQSVTVEPGREYVVVVFFGGAGAQGRLLLADGSGSASGIEVLDSDGDLTEGQLSGWHTLTEGGGQSGAWRMRWARVRPTVSTMQVGLAREGGGGALRIDAVAVTPIHEGYDPEQDDDRYLDLAYPSVAVGYTNRWGETVQTVTAEGPYAISEETTQHQTLDVLGAVTKAWLPVRGEYGTSVIGAYGTEAQVGARASTYYSGSHVDDGVPVPGAGGVPFAEQEYYQDLHRMPKLSRPPGDDFSDDETRFEHVVAGVSVEDGRVRTELGRVEDPDGRITHTYVDSEGKEWMRRQVGSSDQLPEDSKVLHNYVDGANYQTCGAPREAAPETGLPQRTPVSGPCPVIEEVTVQLRQAIEYEVHLEVGGLTNAGLVIAEVNVYEEDAGTSWPYYHPILVMRETVSNEVSEACSETYDGTQSPQIDNCRYALKTGFVLARPGKRYIFEANTLITTDDDHTVEKHARVDAIVRYYAGDLASGVTRPFTETESEYDFNGNLTVVRPPNYFEPPSGTDSDYETRYTYDSAGRMLSQRTPDAGTTTYGYDEHSRMRYSQDANQAAANSGAGEFMLYCYDSVGRISRQGLVDVLPPAGTCPGETDQSVDWRLINRYDEAVNLSDAPFNGCNAGCASFESQLENTAGRLVASAHKSNGQWQATFYSYDADGRVVIEAKRADGAAPEWDYHRFAYDASGKVVWTNVDIGDHELTHYYTYDRRGLLHRSYVSSQASMPSRPAEPDAEYTYDVAGRMAKVGLRKTNGGSFRVLTPYTYDIQGRLVAIGGIDKDPWASSAPFSSRYTYSAAGLIERGDYLTPDAVQYASSITPQDGQWPRWQYRYEYDGLGRLANAKYHEYRQPPSTGYDPPEMTGLQEGPIVYDANGNITALQRRVPAASGGASVIDDLTYSYTPGTNRLSGLGEAAGGSSPPWDAEAMSLSYDPNGNVTVMDSGGEQTSFAKYDERNLPLRVTTPDDLNVHYRYDASGQRIGLQVNTVGFNAGSGGTDPHYKVERYARSGANLVGTFDGEGNLLHWNMQGGPGGPIGRIYPTSVTIALVREVAEQRIRDTLAVYSQTYVAEGLAHAGLAQAEADSLAAVGATSTDAAFDSGVVPSVDVVVDTTQAQANQAGQAYYAAVLTATEDALRGTLVGAGYAQGVADSLAAISAAEAAARATSSVQQVIAAAQQYPVGGTYLERSYYVKDHLGSVRATVSQYGSVREARDYYPFGLEMPGRVWVSGSETREGFTGHELDVETGHYYAGARYYMPALGRWTTTDPMNEYASPYIYVGNNPISLVDPTGMYSDDGWLDQQQEQLNSRIGISGGGGDCPDGTPPPCEDSEGEKGIGDKIKDGLTAVAVSAIGIGEDGVDAASRLSGRALESVKNRAARFSVASREAAEDILYSIERAKASRLNGLARGTQALGVVVIVVDGVIAFERAGDYLEQGRHVEAIGEVVEFGGNTLGGVGGAGLGFGFGMLITSGSAGTGAPVIVPLTLGGGYIGGQLGTPLRSGTERLLRSFGLE